MYIRLPAEQNVRSHSRLTTFCCIFLHVSLHQILFQYVPTLSVCIGFARPPNDKQVKEDLGKRTVQADVTLKGWQTRFKSQFTLRHNPVASRLKSLQVHMSLTL